MNIKTRIERLEKMTCENDTHEPNKIIYIFRVDRSMNPDSEPATVSMAIIPGVINGPNGKTLFRDESETEADFISRAEAEQKELLKRY